MKSKIYEVIVAAFLIATFSNAGFACCPEFPNTLIDVGDSALLSPPVLNFSAELARMKLPAPPFQAVTPTNATRYADINFAEQSREADLTDLRAALTAAHLPQVELEKIVDAQREARQKLETYLDRVYAWQEQQENPWRIGPGNPKIDSRPKLEELDPPADLPMEFSDYFRGLVAYRVGKTDDARDFWQKLLARPEAERKYRTTWAVFMLGRTCPTNEPDKAIEYFQRVRQLANHGFHDSLGLAESSLGWEAQVYLEQKKFARALELYLQQYAAGDLSAPNSLRWTAEAALKTDPATLQSLATNSLTRRVITAYVVGFRSLHQDGYDDEHSRFNPWLDALEKAEVHDVEDAEKLALAAYQNDKMETAQRWINRSLSTPASQWLQAKLYMRAGKIDRAAAILQHLTGLFPITPGTNNPSDTSFESGLYMDFRPDAPDHRTIGGQVLGELGALHLARREYRESLDCLLRSDYWEDAAYVADSVMTVDELKSYVDASWPTTDETETNTVAGFYDSRTPRVEIRWLLARRLTRIGRGHEARPYFQEIEQTNLDVFLSHWDAGQNESLPSGDRAQALFKAAETADEYGMELMGTALDPDWTVHRGRYDFGIAAENRTNCNATVLQPTEDEIQRSKASVPQPNLRFHYRYTAATIAWQAAALMPNNSDETAKMLWTAGCWLKNRDPKGADVFYKALVRRCRKTALGEEADRIRWFPQLDEAGNIIPGKTRRKEQPLTPASSPDNAVAPADAPQSTQELPTQQQ